MSAKQRELVILLDFGTQYSQLIARRIRSANVYCEILPYSTPAAEIIAKDPQGIILSGDCASLLDKDAPICDKSLLQAGIPVLGIGYGMQMMAYLLGGQVSSAPLEESGHTDIKVASSALFADLPESVNLWMSRIFAVEMPEGFVKIAATEACPLAAMEDAAHKLYAVQFHPEMEKEGPGENIFHNFLYKIAGCRGEWTMESYVEEAVEEIRRQVGSKKVLLGLSGGVDSAVVAALLVKAIGKQLTCVLVDHGLMRLNESKEVEAVFRPLLGDNLLVIDACDRFLGKLQGITDPEQKRKIIGKEFIEVFGEAARSQGDLDFLAQGTIYPDVIESGIGASGVVKSHHNVGGLPEDLPFCGLVEPLRYLFKDEVRSIGEQLGLPHDMVWRQPFPGPGLGVRVIGELTKDKLDILREADFILRDEIDKNDLKKQASQYFAVLTGLKSVGVKDDVRNYDYTIALRVINTTDFMTADWVRIPYDVLEKISRRITTEVDHVNRIVYDITSKPPASIEWE